MCGETGISDSTSIPESARWCRCKCACRICNREEHKASAGAQIYCTNNRTRGCIGRSTHTSDMHSNACLSFQYSHRVPIQKEQRLIHPDDSIRCYSGSNNTTLCTKHRTMYRQKSRTLFTYHSSWMFLLVTLIALIGNSSAASLTVSHFLFSFKYFPWKSWVNFLTVITTI